MARTEAMIMNTDDDGDEEAATMIGGLENSKNLLFRTYILALCGGMFFPSH